MKLLVLIGSGGALGAIARYLLSQLTNTWAINQSWSFLPGTLLVNVIGSFTIGAAFALLSQQVLINDSGRLFFLVGFLGAFTTFSTFSLETLQYLQRGDTALALFNIAASVVCSMLAVILGFYIVKAFNA